MRAFELIVNLGNRPGELAALREKLYRAGANMEGGFMAASDKDGRFECAVCKGPARRNLQREVFDEVCMQRRLRGAL